MAPVARFRGVVIDCPDPLALAAFSAGIGGGTPEAEDDDWVVLRIPDGPRLPARPGTLDLVGGATGCTDHPVLDAQPSSEAIVALDGGRVA